MNSFKNLQIVVHLMLIDLFSVAQCEVFLGQVMQVSNLHFFDTSGAITETLPVAEDDEAVNLHFEKFGYIYSDSILGMGPVIIIIVMVPFIILVLLPMKYLCCCQVVRNFVQKQLNLTLFNRVINFVDGSLLAVTTCAWINIYQVNREAIDPSLSHSVSIAALTLIAASLTVLFTYLLVNSRNLET